MNSTPAIRYDDEVPVPRKLTRQEGDRWETEEVNVGQTSLSNLTGDYHLFDRIIFKRKAGDYPHGTLMGYRISTRMCLVMKGTPSTAEYWEVHETLIMHDPAIWTTNRKLRRANGTNVSSFQE